MAQPAKTALSALARPTMNALQQSAGVVSTRPALSLLPDSVQRSGMATSAAPAIGKPGAAEFVLTKVYIDTLRLRRDCSLPTTIASAAAFAVKTASLVYACCRKPCC